MKGHLSDESLLDLAEGRGSEADRAHAAVCATCSGHVSQTAETLAVARSADVPEPPPFYWPALGRAVSRGLGRQPRRLPAWSWLLPLAAATAGIVIALAPGRTAVSPVPAPATAATLPAWSALPPVEEDVGAAMLEAVAVDGESGIAALDEGRSPDAFVAGLSEEEAQSLADRLRASWKESAL